MRTKKQEEVAKEFSKHGVDLEWREHIYVFKEGGLSVMVLPYVKESAYVTVILRHARRYYDWYVTDDEDVLNTVEKVMMLL